MKSHDGFPPAPGSDRDRLCVELAAAEVHDPAARWALDLLARAEPYAVPPGRPERIWQALHAPRPRRRMHLRFALAMTALGACGLCASAALAGWPAWLARVLAIAPAAQVPGPAQSPPRKARLAPHAHPVSVAAAPIAPAPVPALAASAPAEPTAAPVRGRRLAKGPTAETAEDPGVLLEAMRALRIERTPARARALLAAYLDRHPKGALAEEALVMLVEAAVAHRDLDASALAARYFKLYPNGPFRGQVERTLAAYDKP